MVKAIMSGLDLVLEDNTLYQVVIIDAKKGATDIIDIPNVKANLFMKGLYLMDGLDWAEYLHTK